MKSYVRIYGPPLREAIDKLEEVAVDMSKSKEVKFSHRCIPYPRSRERPREYQSSDRDWNNYIEGMKNRYVECYEPVKLISKATEMIGEYDFMFDWQKKPTMEQVQDLIERIDEALEDTGVYYTLTTK